MKSAFALLLALAMPAGATIFIGDVGADEVDVMLPDARQGEVVGVSLRRSKSQSFIPPPLDLRLITGTRNGDHVTLEEWDAPGHRTATVDARIKRYKYSGGWYEGRLRGTWTAGGRAMEADFGNWSDSPTPFQYPDSAAGIVDRLHDDVRAGRWEHATFDAKLLCVMHGSSECGWLLALPELADGRMPAPAPFEPWKPFALERAGRYHEALEAGAEECEYSRMGCLFYTDLATLPKTRPREMFQLACRKMLIRCADAWGSDEIALIEAAWAGNDADVARLLRTRVNVYAGGGRLPTAVQTGAMHGSLSIVKQLVARGADVNLPVDKDGGWLSPLFYAIDNGAEDLAIFLLDRGAQIHGEREENLLWEAAFHRERKVVHKMLELGEKPDDTPVPAGSALTAAVKNRDLVTARDLVAHGADPDFRINHSGGSPVDYARRTKQEAMLRMLLAARRERRRDAAVPAAADGGVP